MANYFNKNKLFSELLSKRSRVEYVEKMNSNLLKASILLFSAALMMTFATKIFIQKYKERDVFLNYTNGKVDGIVVSDEDQKKIYEVIKELRNRDGGK